MDGFDAVYMIKYDIEAIMNTQVPLHMFTDWKQLLDAIFKSSSIREKYSLLMYQTYLRPMFHLKSTELV